MKRRALRRAAPFHTVRTRVPKPCAPRQLRQRAQHSRWYIPCETGWYTTGQLLIWATRPDFVTPTVIGEIKAGKEVYWSRQIQAEMGLAVDTHRAFHLIVQPNAHITDRLLRVMTENADRGWRIIPH